MIEIAKTARKEIKKIVEGEKTPSPVRITMAGGCVGPHLGMLLDAARPGDHVFELEGVRYVIDRVLLFRLQPITVDFTEGPFGAKFAITSAHPVDDP